MLMAIIGISGRIGQKVYEHFKDKFDIIGIDIINFSSVKTFKHLYEVDSKIDILIDFSSINALEELKYAVDNGILTISGTTGYSDEIIQMLKDKGNGLFHWSSNFSRGIDLFTRLIQLIKKEYSLFDFIEIHAATKKDAPSGTAKMLANNLGISFDKIQSLRINYAPPIHELIFSSHNEQITIRHEVTSSDAFIEGLEDLITKLLGSG